MSEILSGNRLKTTYRTKSEIRKQIESKFYPFDAIRFYDDNVDLVLKYLKKRTLRLVVSEETEIPEEWQYKLQPSVLSVSGSKKRQLGVLEMLEWIKCSLDPIYYCKKYITITLADGGLSKFKMFKYQEEMIELFEGNRFTVACLGRQLGKTTVVAAYLTYVAHFHETKQCAVLANKADQAQEIMERIQQSYESLPLFLKPGVRVYNKRSVTFWNKAKIFSGASSKSSVRGRSISILYWDEAAFTPNDNEFYESIYPTISSGKETKMILTSTPNGKRGVFYKLWSSPNNGFAKIKAIWSDNPTRDEEWKEATIAATSPEQFAQEFCCDFRGSQHSLISSATMVDLFHIDPIRKNESGLKVYKPTQPNHIYFITCDVSRGIGGDYHAFTVIDITNKNEFEVVATFRNNKLSPLIYPTLIHNVAQEYNNAFILVELNDIGEQVANILYYDLEYENILMTVSENNRQTIGFSADSKPGVRTTTQVKSIGCSNLKTLVEKRKLLLNDDVIIDELANFVPKGKSFEADTGATDDLVMTLVLFSWATTQRYFMDMTDIDLRNKLLQDIEKMNYEDLAPFGIIENEFGEYTGDAHIPSIDSDFYAGSF